MHAFLPVPLHSSEKKTWEEAQYEEENLIPTQTLMNKKCLLWLPIIQSPSDLRQEIWGELVLAHCNFDLILRLNWWHRLQLRIRIDVWTNELLKGMYLHCHIQPWVSCSAWGCTCWWVEPILHTVDTNRMCLHPGCICCPNKFHPRMPVVDPFP